MTKSILTALPAATLSQSTQKPSAVFSDSTADLLLVKRACLSRLTAAMPTFTTTNVAFFVEVSTPVEVFTGLGLTWAPSSSYC